LIEFDTEGPVGIITLNRPPVNAFDEAQVEAFAQAATAAERDDELKVLLIRGAGKRFCAGADIEMLGSWTRAAHGRALLQAFSARMQRTFSRLADAQIATVAAIRGAATGGGAELALACDLRVVAEDARIGLTEVRLGLLPGAGGTQRVTDVAGRGTALRLLLRGELVPGADAVALGLAEFAVPEPEVDDHALALAREIAQWPRATLRAIKASVLAHGRDGYLKETQYTGELIETPETRELLNDFFARRS
jgi:enoyl-CoA hydratase/carnithine racemase